MYIQWVKLYALAFAAVFGLFGGCSSTGLSEVEAHYPDKDHQRVEQNGTAWLHLEDPASSRFPASPSIRDIKISLAPQRLVWPSPQVPEDWQSSDHAAVESAYNLLGRQGHLHRSCF